MSRPIPKVVLGDKTFSNAWYGMADRAIADRGKLSALRYQLRIEGRCFGSLNGVDLRLPNKQGAGNDDRRHNDEYRSNQPAACHRKFSREARQPRYLLRPVDLSNKQYRGRRVPCHQREAVSVCATLISNIGRQ
jgi:hypothetical protein